MHRSKAACNQDKITHEYWRVVRMTNVLSEVTDLCRPFWSIDPKSSQISVTYFNVQLIRRPLSLKHDE